MTLAELAALLGKTTEIDPTLEKALLSDQRSGAVELVTRHRRSMEKRTRENLRLDNLLAMENKLWEAGFQFVSGIDEAGRGPLAGPVVAAAVILRPGTRIEHLNDSKKLTAARRKGLYEEIIVEALAYGIGSASPEEIDEINIHQASFLAMKRALERLSLTPDYLLVDGFPLPGSPYQQKAVKGGDALSMSIAAASVLAKVTRDEMMLNLHQDHPRYGFNSNMGYGTIEHRQALCRYGPCPVHRRSFRLDYNL